MTQRTDTTRRWLAFGASLLVYVVATAAIGRDSLQHLSTTIQHDPGDPLLTAAILRWNATHVPLTDAWWQFPIFQPSRDALAFSEHLLGLSVIATPIDWITGHPLITYNLVALLTNPLCGIAMYALVWRLTRNAPGAFLAGLAYAFAPYRVSQLPHIQMLAVFWAPLALLGLHAYLETRRSRWLVLYGAAWLLQLLANNYYVFFFSLLIAFWGIWFVLARRDWRALGAITVATAIAALPLAPILYKYLEVHEAYGLVRNLDEIQFFSADVGAVLCAPADLTFWGWLRIECRAEGELFPGAALVVIACVLGLIAIALGTSTIPAPRRARLVRGVCLVIGGYYVAVICSILIFGPWRFFVGPLAVSARSMTRPVFIAVPTLTIALALWLWFKRQTQAVSTLSFYLLSAVILWALSLGPQIVWMEKKTNMPGLFSFLLYVPGMNGLRVPARFWALAVLCLSAAAGIVVAELLKRRSPKVAIALTPLLAMALLADGWTRIPAVNPPPDPVRQADVAGSLVMTLPITDVPTDIVATYHATVGGWRAVNGYSGYITNYYPALKDAFDTRDRGLFAPFQAYGALHVLVPLQDVALNAFLTEQPGVRMIGRTNDTVDYLLPPQGQVSDGRSAGQRLPVATISSACGRDSLALALDGVRDTGWTCYSEQREQTLDIDLGRTATVGAIVTTLAQHYDTYPTTLDVTTSVDGTTWEAAWNGGLLGQTIRGGIQDPNSLRLTIPIAPRPARYIRLHHPAMPKPYYWWMSELEIWTGNTGIAER